MKNDCIVLIPTYNERENIVEIIKAVMAQPESVDILVIDDNSPDETGALVKQLQGEVNMTAGYEKVQLLERKKKEGLGRAYIAGFKYALDKGYQYICQMDADFSHDPKDMVKLYRSCRDEGADLSIGSRYLTGVNVVNWSMGRVLMSWCASKYVQTITGMPIKDATAGFVCYKRVVLETIPLDKVKFVGYAFQIEMKYKTYISKFDIKEVPIIFMNRMRGKSKMSSSIFKEAFFGVISLRLFAKATPKK